MGRKISNTFENRRTNWVGSYVIRSYTQMRKRITRRERGSSEKGRSEFEDVGHGF